MDQIDPDDQLVEAPNAAQQRWIVEQLAMLRDFGVALAFPALAECFDQMRAEWFSQPEGQRFDPDEGIAAIGVGLGKVLVDELGLRWAVVSDHTGSDLAVVGDPGSITLYPVAAVAARWNDDPDSTIEGFGEWAVEQIRTVQAQTAV